MPFFQKPSQCPVCNTSVEFQFIRDHKNTEGEFSLYECTACHVQFWIPFESRGALWYEAKTKYQISNVLAQGITRGYHEEFLRLHPNLRGKKVLDVGCGSGEFLAELEKRGAMPWGVDFDHNAVESAKKFFGLSHVYATSLQEFSAQFPQTFDFVTCFETIQYSARPVSLLETIRGLLALDGVCVLSIASRERFFPNLVQWDFPPNHLSRWNERALLHVALAAGFKNILVRYVERFGLLKETMSSPFQMGFAKKALSGGQERVHSVRFLGTLKSYLIGTVPAVFLLLIAFVTRKNHGTIYAEFRIA